MNKFAMFVFNGDPMCFIHVLLNAIDFHDKGNQTGIVIEGAATGLLPELVKPSHPLNTLWEKVKSTGLVAGVCKACANKTGSLESVKAQNLAILDEMNGHPSMARYHTEGYEVITF